MTSRTRARRSAPSAPPRDAVPVAAWTLATDVSAGAAPVRPGDRVTLTFGRVRRERRVGTVNSVCDGDLVLVRLDTPRLGERDHIVCPHWLVAEGE